MAPSASTSLAQMTPVTPSRSIRLVAAWPPSRENSACSTGAIDRPARSACSVNAASTWLDAADGGLAFDRGGVECVVNLSPRPIRLPARAELLAASWPIDGGLLPPDCAVWLRTS
jgi:hypothetical protein